MSFSRFFTFSKPKTEGVSPHGNGYYTGAPIGTTTSLPSPKHVSQRKDGLAALGLQDLTNQLLILGDTPFAHGVWSSIWLGELVNTGENVAVKLVSPSRPTAGDDIVQEATLWSRAMDHENVLPLLGYASLKNSLALVSPWVSGGNLKMFLENHPDADQVKLLLDVARGLAHSHDRGIIYGNLRPTTVVVTGARRAQLSSFLFANSLKERMKEPGMYSSSAANASGSGYPYMFEGAVESDDVLSFGSLILETSPMSRKEQDNLKNAILLKQIPKDEIQNWKNKLWTLIQRCWAFDSKDRPAMKNVVSFLEELVTERGETDEVETGKVPPESRPLMDISAQIKKLSEHPIAGGGYCDLYLGERLGKEQVALKLVRLFGSTEADKEIARKRFLREASIWASLYHPRILEFYGICDYGTLSLFMVSPFLSNGNIMRYLAEVAPEANRYKLLVEAAEGLAYLHSRQPPIIHGDLKGANILVSNSGSAVLADFGLARLSHEATTANLQGAGSPRWLAPELVHTSDIPDGVPLKTIGSDVYAFGHVMLEVLSNRPPWFNTREDLLVLVQLINWQRAPRPTGAIADKLLTEEAWDYSQKCCSINPTERPDMPTVVSDLSCIFSVPSLAVTLVDGSTYHVF